MHDLLPTLPRKASRSITTPGRISTNWRLDVHNIPKDRQVEVLVMDINEDGDVLSRLVQEVQWSTKHTEDENGIQSTGYWQVTPRDALENVSHRFFSTPRELPLNFKPTHWRHTIR